MRSWKLRHAIVRSGGVNTGGSGSVGSSGNNNVKVISMQLVNGRTVLVRLESEEEEREWCRILQHFITL